MSDAVIHFTCNIHASSHANTLRYANGTLVRVRKYGVRSTFALAAGPKSLAQSVELHFRLQTHACTLSRVATGPCKSQGRAGQQGKHAFSTASGFQLPVPSTAGMPGKLFFSARGPGIVNSFSWRESRGQIRDDAMPVQRFSKGGGHAPKPDSRYTEPKCCCPKVG